MNKRTWISLFTVAMAALLSGPGLTDKTTVDPNSQPSAMTSTTDKKPDPRLAQKITYDSGSKRLHVVIEEIGQMAGINRLRKQQE